MSLFRYCTSFGPLVIETTTTEQRKAMADEGCAHYYREDIALTSFHEIKSVYVGLSPCRCFEMWDSTITFGPKK